jgi:hypothetical protein
VLATIASTTTKHLVVAASVGDGRRGATAALPGALTEGFQDAFLVGAGFALLGILAALVMIRSADSRALSGPTGRAAGGTVIRVGGAVS